MQDASIIDPVERRIHNKIMELVEEIGVMCEKGRNALEPPELEVAYKLSALGKSHFEMFQLLETKNGRKKDAADHFIRGLSVRLSALNSFGSNCDLDFAINAVVPEIIKQIEMMKATENKRYLSRSILSFHPNPVAMEVLRMTPTSICNRMIVNALLDVASLYELSEDYQSSLDSILQSPTFNALSVINDALYIALNEV